MVDVVAVVPIYEGNTLTAFLLHYTYMGGEFTVEVVDYLLYDLHALTEFCKKHAYKELATDTNIVWPMALAA